MPVLGRGHIDSFVKVCIIIGRICVNGTGTVLSQERQEKKKKTLIVETVI